MRIFTSRLFYFLIFGFYSVSGFALFGFKKHKKKDEEAKPVDTIIIAPIATQPKYPLVCGHYSNDPTVDSLLCFAFTHVGKPYSSGSAGPNAFDCSGFTSYVYSQFGYKLNRSSGSQPANGIPVERNQLAPGDLVFFKGRNSYASRIGHVGIVASVKDDGSFTFIHSANGTGITENTSTAPYYLKRYVTACRVISPESLTPRTTFLKKIEPISLSTKFNKEEEVLPEKPKPFEYTRKLKQIKVKKGQSLFSIADEYDCSVSDIKEWNNLRRNQLNVGQKLIIHLSEKDKNADTDDAELTTLDKKESKSLSAKDNLVHKVAKGESLLIISQKYDCTIDDLKNWNNLEGTTIRPGQKLLIRKDGQDQNIEYTETNLLTPSENEQAEHEVAKGESLRLISQKYNCSIADLKNWNNLTSSKLIPGQKLKIREPEEVTETVELKPSVRDLESSKEHTVLRGESLLTISKKYACSIDQLKELNNLEGSKIQIGQKLKVPSAESTTTALKTTLKEESVTADNDGVHEVAKGESLLIISKKYGCSIKDLKDWNDLDNSKIQVGQKLKTKPTLTVSSSKAEPKAESQTKKVADESQLANARKELMDIQKTDDIEDEHIVAKGESLFGIASKYECSINDLKAWNQLEKSTVYPGQKLKIRGENGEKIKPAFHVVSRGESLYSIAEQYQTTVKALQEINDLDSEGIQAGQRLRVK